METDKTLKYEYLLRLGESLINLENGRISHKYLNQILEVNPLDPYVNLLMAKTYDIETDEAKKLMHYDKALDNW